jgi:hypothetical protein
MGRRLAGARVALFSAVFSTGTAVMIFIVGPSVGRGVETGLRECGARVSIGAAAGWLTIMLNVGALVILLVVGSLVIMLNVGALVIMLVVGSLVTLLNVGALVIL